MSPKSPIYALYVGVQAVELRFNEDPDFGTARFICAQTNCQQILDFGVELAKSKGLPFADYTEQPTRTYNEFSEGSPNKASEQ